MMGLEHVSKFTRIWRPGLAMIQGARLAAWLLGVMFTPPRRLVFAPAPGGASAVGLLVWRTRDILAAKGC